MTAYRFDLKNAAVAAHATKHEAGSYGNSQPIVTSLQELIDAVSIPTSSILAIYNKLTNEKVARFSDREAGAKRLWKVLLAIEPKKSEAAPAPKVAKEKKAAGAAKAGRKPGTGEFAGKTVHALKDVNPRRVGTAGFKSFEIIRGKKDGVSYADYIAAGGRPQDLRWDIDHKWAKVS